MSDLLLQKIYTVNWIDENHQEQKLCFLNNLKAQEKILELKDQGISEVFLTCVTTPFAKSSV
jgi:hypothetical protein